MAIVQLRNDTEGRASYRRKLATGKTPMEGIRALKRRLSDIVYRQLVNDQKRLRGKEIVAGPGGQAGAATGSSAAGSNPDAGASEKSLPGPAGADSTPAAADLRNHSSTRSRRPRRAPTAAGVKRSLLDTGEDRPSNSEAGTALLTQRGAMTVRRPL